MSKRRNRKPHGCRNFLLYCLIVAAVWYIGTFTLKTTEVTIETDKISNDITIVQLTDLHGATFGTGNRYLLDKIKDANPDFIVSTGDMYTAQDEEGMHTAEELLGRLAKTYPVYAVNGEHDADSDYEQRLKDAGVDVLDYESRDITVGDSMVRLYGITNVYYSDTFDLANEFTLDEGVYNLLAAHISHFQAFSDFGMDLSLCGDSHGGQVRLPYLGALINRGIWLPERESGEAKYTKGLYENGDKNLFVSSGLGTYPVPVRFLNRPEVAVIKLVAK